MRIVHLWTAASACLLGCTAASAADPLLTNKLTPRLTLSNVADPATVTRSRLFLSTDSGKTWTVAQEIRLDTPTTAPIRFQLKFDRDGTYAVYTCTSYRDGRVEAEPLPGMMPPTTALLTVDTAAPAVNRFDATLSGRAAAKAVVRVTWSAGDTHLGNEPVTVEASTNGGAQFTAIHHGAADGGTELTIPVTPDTKELQLRLTITDRANNTTVSPVRVLAMQGVPAPAASVTAAPVTPGTPPAPAITPVAVTTPQPTSPTTTPAVTPIATAPVTTPIVSTPATTPPTTPATAPPAAPATPSDPLTELAKAAKTLPTLEAVGATAPKPLPTTPVPPAVPVKSPAVTTVPVKAPTAPPVLVAAPAPAPAPIPEPRVPQTDVAVTVPPAPIPEKALVPTAPAVVATKPAPPVVAPAVTAKPAPVSPPPTVTKAVAPPTLDGTRPTPAAPNGNYLSTAIAQLTLTNARDLARIGNVDDACDLYERLRQSPLAKTALLEEVQLLNRNARPRDAQLIAASASIEMESDTLRLEHGTALVTLGRHADAQRVLSGVRGNAPESRPALLLIARAALALGQNDDARMALEHLGRGTDAPANDARVLLQRLDNR